jgi:hypothetical protein
VPAAKLHGGEKRVTERASWYRANAEKCLSLAQRFRDPQSRRVLVAMANVWLAMAEQRSSRSELTPVSDTPSQPLKRDPDKPDAD